MNIRPEDRPKMAGIAAAIVGINIYVFATVIPRLSGAQPAPTQQSAPAPTPAPPLSAANAAPAGAAATTPSVNDFNTDAAPPKDVAPDPFKPPPGAPLPDAPPAAVPQPKAAPTAGKSLPQPQPSAPMPPAQLASVAAPPTAAPAPLPEVTLKGIIDGKPAVAVFQVGEETFNVGEHHKLVGGLFVAKITEAGVLLRLGKKTYGLDVGHSLQSKNGGLVSSRLMSLPPDAPVVSAPSVPSAPQTAANGTNDGAPRAGTVPTTTVGAVTAPQAAR